jgi:hypothetical protein
VPRSPQGGRRIERSLTSKTPWRSAVPPLPVPQGSGRDTADSNSGQTPAARCALRCISATAGGIDPPAARAARWSGGRGQPRYGMYLEGEQSPWKMKCPASGNGRVALRLGSGATPRRRLSSGGGGAKVWQRIDAAAASVREERMRGGPFRRIRAHPVFSVFPIPGSRCAQARRVLRSVRAMERHGGNGRGDTVRLLARESSGGMNASRGRGDVHSARDGNVSW